MQTIVTYNQKIVLLKDDINEKGKAMKRDICLAHGDLRDREKYTPMIYITSILVKINGDVLTSQSILLGEHVITPLTDLNITEGKQ